MYELNIGTVKREEMIDITRIVNDILKKENWDKGILYLFIPHTTAAITINENADPDVRTDIIKGLKLIVPDIEYRHYEGNSDAHIKTSMLGVDINIFVENKSMVLGKWQALYFCEFDGPRKRTVYLKFIKE